MSMTKAGRLTISQRKARMMCSDVRQRFMGLSDRATGANTLRVPDHGLESPTRVSILSDAVLRQTDDSYIRVIRDKA